MKYKVKFTGQFKKDLKLLKKNGAPKREYFITVTKIENSYTC